MRSDLGARLRVIGLACAVLLAPPPARATDPPYDIEIQKSEQVLLVKHGDTVERTYHIALGRGGHGDKRMHGDNRTPVGVYRIADFNHNSRFYMFMHLNYPNVKDAFWGYKNHLISEDEFNRILSALRRGALPPQTTALGGSIGIHGIGELTEEKLRIHRSANWTEGCIAMTNAEIDELRRYVGVGTRVEIKE